MILYDLLNQRQQYVKVDCYKFDIINVSVWSLDESVNLESKF